jgi:hypothetical protein
VARKWVGRHHDPLRRKSRPRRSGIASSQIGATESVFSGDVTGQRCLDFGPCRSASFEISDIGELFGFEIFVDRKEVLDLGECFGRDVIDIDRIAPSGLAVVNTQNLGVAASIIDHPHHANWADMNPTSREGGVLGEYEDIERVAVFGECVGDEAVLGGVGRGGEEAAIEADTASFMVYLVLISAASGDFDDDIDGFHFAILPGSMSFRGRTCSATVRDSPTVTMRKLTSTDGFVVIDLDDAPTAVGIVRSAPKVLVDGVTWLARSETYRYAFFGRKVSGASAAVNAPVDAKAEAISSFATELAEDSFATVHLSAGRGISADDLAGLRSRDPRPEAWWSDRDALTAAGIVAAADQASGGLSGRTVAIETFDSMTSSLVDLFRTAGATVVEPDVSEDANAVLHADVEILVAGSKVGLIGHANADNVKARILVPSGPMPVTAKALAAFERASVVVLPDFVTTSGHLAAWPVDGSSTDAAALVGDAIAQIIDAPNGPLLGACEVAEAFLESWAAVPFGRPIA